MAGISNQLTEGKEKRREAARKRKREGGEEGREDFLKSLIMPISKEFQSCPEE